MDIDSRALAFIENPAPTNVRGSDARNRSPYSVDDRGVWFHGKDNDGNNLEPEWICSPLSVTALVRDQAGENWGRLLEFADADRTRHVWAMPMTMLAGSGEDLRRELLRLGLSIAPSVRARNHLAAYITTADTKKRARCVERTGWHGGVFVLPDRTIGHETERVIYQAEATARHYSQAGTLSEWQSHVAALCAGNSRLVLAVSAAFAAMLLERAGAENGGLHFVGISSTGKTSALRVACSVFGDRDYLQRWRATSNGIEGLASLHSDALLILDELAQVDAREAGEVAYMLGNGTGKTRATRTGAAKQRKTFRLLFLSAGEIGLSQHMREAGKKARAGQEVRLVDVPADAGAGLGVFEDLHDHDNGAAFADALKRTAATYYGTPALAFLESATEPDNFKNLPTVLKALTQGFIKEHLPEDGSGQARRVCERFALIAAAGEIATHYGVTGWDKGEAEKAAATCFKAWLEQRGGAGDQERQAILSQVRRFFEQHGDSRFALKNDADQSKTINRCGFREVSSDGTRYYVLPEAFRNEVCSGVESRAACKMLVDAGWIELDRDGKAQRREYLPGMGRTRCYVFSPRMWEA